jgi:acyl-CoA thioester hydrolase
VVMSPGKAEGYALAVPVEVRFRDMDSMGHVNNAVYFTYFENARIAYWRAVPGIRSRRNLDYILARAECDFKSPTTLEDDLCCHIRVAFFGRSSFAFDYLLRDERTGRSVAEGRTVQVMYDYAGARKRPVDEDTRAAIESFEGRTIPPRTEGGAHDEG